MGRLAQKGLDYFSMDTTWETAVKLVKAKFGTLEGVGFLTEIWASIYRENYYRTWDDEAELLFADEIKKPVEWVHEVIEYCFDKNILDRNVYDAHKVLTSHGIQKRYFKIARESLKRTYIDYIDGITYPEFMPENNLGGKADIHGGNRDIPGGKADYTGGNDDNTRQYNTNEFNTKKGKTYSSSRDEPSDSNPPPAASVSNLTEEVHKALYDSRFRSSFTASECVGIADRLSQLGLDAGFVEYAILKTSEAKARNPNAFLRSALLAGKGFEDWPEKYRAALESTPKEKPKRRPSPPERCTCGERIARAGDLVVCKACASIWEYDSAFETWMQSGKKWGEDEKVG